MLYLLLCTTQVGLNAVHYLHYYYLHYLHYLHYYYLHYYSARIADQRKGWHQGQEAHNAHNACHC